MATINQINKYFSKNMDPIERFHFENKWNRIIGYTIAVIMLVGIIIASSGIGETRYTGF